MNGPNDKTPDWLIERLALGELDAAEAAEVRRRLAAEGRAAEEILGALAASNRQILGEHPPAAVAASVRARAAKAAAPRRRAIWFGAPLALAGAAAALLLVARPGSAPVAPGAGPSDAPETTQIKGPPSARAPRLYVYRRAVTGGSERLGDGAQAARGDVVQLAYTTGEPAFGVLLSLDGAGHVTVHLPDPAAGRSAMAVPLAAAREVRLPSAYELDDAPAFERFFLITADRPFPAAAAVDAARKLAGNRGAARREPLPLGPSLQQMSLALVKQGEAR